MLIIADPAIAEVESAFSALGELRLLPGRGWTPQSILAAQVLLVRSVTRADRGLIEGSRVQFIGTATSGTDHLDLHYLECHGVQWCAAPGSNARSVAEYVLSAILSCHSDSDLRDLRVGIIGYGHTGRQVAVLLDALGIPWIANDPPLGAAGGGLALHALDEVLQADIVTLHVPLTHHGPYPTAGLIDAARLEQMKPAALIINTARGGVVCEADLKAAILSRGLRAVIDCWEGEPCIDLDLLRISRLGTPHIAGYSRDGKLKATQALHAALCRYLGRTPYWQPGGEHTRICELALSPHTSDAEALHRAVRASYDPHTDDAALRALLREPGEERGGQFERLRAHYRLRREFPSTAVSVSGQRPDLTSRLRALGFEVRVSDRSGTMEP
ncbi:MAG: 4-phosphoerythronate dehydrogenase [Gammaproteobacteria bacterium]